MTINWDNPSDKISNHFTVHEATYLPSWNICHSPSEGEKANILEMAKTMDIIREFLGHPIKIHCWTRPTQVNCPGSDHDGENYNSHVGGATHSAHIQGNAVDWDSGQNCDDVRDLLEPNLELWGIRMEDNAGSSWVHTDRNPPNPNRFFKP